MKILDRTLLIVGWVFATSISAQSIDYWHLDSIRLMMDASAPVFREKLAQRGLPEGEQSLLRGLSYFQQEPDSAIFHFEQASEIFNKNGREEEAHISRAFMAETFLYVSRYQEALEILSEELEFAINNNILFLEYQCLSRLVATHYLLQNFETAVNYADRILLRLCDDYPPATFRVTFYKIAALQTMAAKKIPLDGVVQDHSVYINMIKELSPKLEEYGYFCPLSRVKVLEAFGYSLEKSLEPDSIINILDVAIEKAVAGECPKAAEFAFSNKIRYLSAEKRDFDEMDMMEDMVQRYPENDNYTYWIHSLLAGIYNSKGEYQKAYEHQLKSSEIAHEMFSNKIAASAAKQEVRFKTFEKELENERLAAKVAVADAEKRNLWLIFSLCLILLIAAAIVFWMNYRNRTKRKEEQMMTRLLLEGEQKERMRIARDLHDSVGQMLSAIRLHLITSGRSSTGNIRTMSLLDKTIEEVRSISHNLLPKSLDYFGLTEAIKDLASQYNTSGKIKVNVSVMGNMENITITKQQELMIFRIIQESMQNIVKHSDAPEIDINLINSVSELRIALTYHGQIPSREALEESTGIGWKNIMSRMKLLNGEIDFHKRGNESVIRMKVNVNTAA